MSTPREAILRTLAYAAVFRSGVTRTELSRWLISSQSFAFLEIDEYFSSGKWPAMMHRKRVDALPWGSWRKAIRFVKSVSWIPWIQSIWVTGSVAVNRSNDREDIDFMIVTAPNRLWLTRLLVMTLGLLTGQARTLFSSASAGKWCLNLWLEPSAFRLDPDRQRLYTAREVIQAVPIFARDSRPEAFLEHNTWVKDWTANGWQYAFDRARGLHLRTAGFWYPVLTSTPLSPVWNFLNSQAYRVQSRLIARHLTRETVRLDRAFFHPRDTASAVLPQYERICGILGVSPWPKTALKPSNVTTSLPTGRPRKSKRGSAFGSRFVRPKTSTAK